MNKYRVGLITLIGLHFLLIFLTGLFRHWGFLTSINDLANFDQAVWGAIQGNPLLNTDTFDLPTSRLGVHFDPIQLIFTPLYLIYPTVHWFTAGQSIALSITAWPLYIWASRQFESEKIGLMWALIFLVNPFLLNAAAWDFHPITLAVPFVALGFVALDSKNFRLMLFCALMILLCKEHLGVMIIGFGLLWGIRTRQWTRGFILTSIGLLHFYLVLKVIMPAFSPTGQHVMLSEGLGQLSRYSWLGPSLTEIMRTLITQPVSVLKTVLFSMGGLGYLLILLLPFLFFPLLSPLLLLPGMADLAANMLSNITMPRRVWAYHSAALIPILTVAAMHGVKFAGRWIKKFSAGEISSMILIASIFMGYLFAPFPLPGALNYWAPVSFTSFPDPRVKEIRSLIGEESAVSAQANVGAHFSQRREIYCFPNRIDQVDAVVLRLESPTTRLTPQEPGPLGTLADHLQLPLVDYLKIVEQTLIDENFIIAYWDDPWLVFHRAEHGRKAAAKEEEIRLKINMLKQLWLNTDMSPAPKSAAN